MFIQNVIDFLIIAFVIFMMIKMITKMQQLKSQEPEPLPPPPEPTNEEKLLTEIRDLLKK
jgi:large conductance mechanosensitive channel